jgi:hypothetical protein
MELPPEAICSAQEPDRVMGECRESLKRVASRDELGQLIYPLGPN